MVRAEGVEPSWPIEYGPQALNLVRLPDFARPAYIWRATVCQQPFDQAPTESHREFIGTGDRGCTCTVFRPPASKAGMAAVTSRRRMVPKAGVEPTRELPLTAF